MSQQKLIAIIFLTVSLPAPAVRADMTNQFPMAVNDARLKAFARLKHQQMEELASKFTLNVPPEAEAFFKAAETGDWKAMDQYEDIYNRSILPGAGLSFLGLQNSLFVPVQETLGAYESYAYFWNAPMLQKFADGILRSIPPGSIYFGGTDPGRWIITAVQYTDKSPDIFVMTQNGLAESRYMDYLRETYGGKLSLPDTTDVQAAFRQVADDLSRTPVSDVQITEDKKGQAMSVHGIKGVMAVNAILTKWIFDHNKDKHEFYVEEGFYIPWMAPYLEPHELISKLNNEPMKGFDPAIVMQDRQFWEALTKELFADPHFLDNKEAHRVFSKLRSGIGGVYAYRHLTTEAEAAYRQSLAFYPMSSEGNYRLAQLYLGSNRVNDAITVMEKFRDLLKSTDSYEREMLKDVESALEQIHSMKKQAETKKLPTNSSAP